VHEEGSVRIYSGFERAEEFNRVLIESGVGIVSSHMSEENLEDHFVKLTGDDAEDETRSPGRRGGSRGWQR